MWCLPLKCTLRQPIVFCWLNLENFSWNYTLWSYLWISNNGLSTYLPLGWSVKQSHFLVTLPNKGQTPGTNLRPCGSRHGDNPTTPKIIFDHIKEAILAKEWKLFPSREEETRLPTSQGFSQIWMWIILEATTDTITMWDSLSLNTPQIIDLGDGQLSLFVRIIDYVTFALIIYLKNEAHFVVECPLYNSIGDKFQSLLKKGVSSISFD